MKTKNVVKNKIGDLPATTAVLTNNQIGRYIDKEGATILENVFSATANGTGKAFFQSKAFTILQDSYAFKFKDESITKKSVYLFFLASLNKVFQKYSWDNKSIWERIRQEKIYLPIKNKQIDFDFIEKFSMELKAAHMAELKAYLLATGLEENEVTPHTHTHTERERERERAVFQAEIEDLYLNTIWKEFRIKDIFEIKNAYGLDANKVEIYDEQIKGTFPYIGRQTKNNGVRGYIIENEKYLNLANRITFSQVNFACFYQKEKFFSSQNIKLLEPKYYEKFSAKVFLFFVATIQKIVSGFSYQSFSNSKIANISFYLPINSQNQIDFDFIEKFVVLIEKIIVKELWLYTEN
ncbi:restriction endonuclease subunit S [Mesomycoplasma hyopneumoniae]|uniref:restriction endonuclease subunit S n=1 Tax=Mesomycoplasma hyopneumoniae TaxID=2099 RepID=UPI003DA342F8